MGRWKYRDCPADRPRTSRRHTTPRLMSRRRDSLRRIRHTPTRLATTRRLMIGAGPFPMRRRAAGSPARSRGGTAIGSGVFLGVHDAIVCLVDLVHPLGGVRIVGVQIGVVLARLPAVCLLHLVLRGIPRHAEYAIRVHCHCVPYSPSSSAALAADDVISPSSWAASPNFPQYCPHSPAYSTLRRI